MDSEFEFYSDDDFDQELPPIPKSMPKSSSGLMFKPRMRDSVFLKKQSINGDYKTEMAKHLEEIEKSILELTRADQVVQKPDQDPEAKFWKSSKSSNSRKPSNASNLISEFVRNLEIDGFTIGSPVDDKPVKDIIPLSINVDDSPAMKSTMSPKEMDDNLAVKSTKTDEKPVKRTADIPPRKNSKAALPPPVPKLEDIKNYAEIFKSKVKNEKTVTETVGKDIPEVVLQTITLEEIITQKESSVAKKELEKFKRSGHNNEDSKEKIPPKEESVINTITVDEVVKKEAPTRKRSARSRKRSVREKERHLVSSDEERFPVKDQSLPETKDKEGKPVARKRSTRKNKKDPVQTQDADTKPQEPDDLDIKNDSGVEVLPNLVSTDEQDKTTSSSDSERGNARVELLGKLKARSPTETTNNQIPASDRKDYEEGVVDLLDVYYPAKKHILSMAIHDIFDVYDPAISSVVTTIAEEEPETVTTAYTDSLILLYNPLVEDKLPNPLSQVRKKLPSRGKASKTIKLRKPKSKVDVEKLKDKSDVPKSAVTLKRKPSGRLNLGAKQKLR